MRRALPCRASHLYFNRADVREALHVQAVQEEAGLWLGVNPQVSTAYIYDITSVIPQHQFLISRGKAQSGCTICTEQSCACLYLLAGTHLAAANTSCICELRTAHLPHCEPCISLRQDARAVFSSSSKRWSACCRKSQQKLIVCELKEASFLPLMICASDKS